MIESNKTQCKVCKAMKDRIEDGRYPDGRNKRWKDEDGKLWNGHICAACNKISATEAMKKLRDERKAFLAETGHAYKTDEEKGIKYK